jgi:hypothetical protein
MLLKRVCVRDLKMDKNAFPSAVFAKIRKSKNLDSLAMQNKGSGAVVVKKRSFGKNLSLKRIMKNIGFGFGFAIAIRSKIYASYLAIAISKLRLSFAIGSEKHPNFQLICKRFII